MADIPRVYLNTDMENIVTVKFRGNLAKIMPLIYTEAYCKYMIAENRKTVLYVRLKWNYTDD